MSRRFKLMALVLVIVLLISSMSVLLTACNNKNEWMLLQDAYERGLIDMQELKSIICYYSPSTEGLGEGFEPLPLNPATLSEERIEEIRLKLESFLIEQNKENYAGCMVEKYLGTYKNGMAFYTFIGGNYIPEGKTIEIGGLEVYFRSTGFIYFWVS